MKQSTLNALTALNAPEATPVADAANSLYDALADKASEAVAFVSPGTPETTIGQDLDAAVDSIGEVWDDVASWFSSDDDVK